MNSHSRGSEQNCISEDSEHFGLVDRNADELSDCNAWHNRFLIEIIKCVNAEIFKPIISGSETLLPEPHFVVGFMVLKESWNQSFDFIRGLVLLDPVVRQALGISDISRIPSGRSVFDFLQKCRDYYETTGQDLLNRAFLQTVHGRVLSYETDGAVIRVDKDLLENYIPDMISLEQAQHALETGINSISAGAIPVPSELRKAILDILGTDADEFFYNHSSSDVNGRKWLLGKLLFLLIKHCRLYRDKESLQVKVFNEQFRCSLEDSEGEDTDESENRKHDADDSKEFFNKTEGSENRNHDAEKAEKRSVCTDKSGKRNLHSAETEKDFVSSETAGKYSRESAETKENTSESGQEKSLSDSTDNQGFSLWDLINADENQVRVEPRKLAGAFSGEEQSFSDKNIVQCSDNDRRCLKFADIQTENLSSLQKTLESTGKIKTQHRIQMKLSELKIKLSGLTVLKIQIILKRLTDGSVRMIKLKNSA